MNSKSSFIIAQLELCHDISVWDDVGQALPVPTKFDGGVILPPRLRPGPLLKLPTARHSQTPATDDWLELVQAEQCYRAARRKKTLPRRNWMMPPSWPSCMQDWKAYP